ncbi:hypothetical protein BAG01nite_48160 [Brevibacillus agri]|nr:MULTISPECIES: MarR family winged helix-turn-helix transcriptional regulator [Brevibacillus]ELK39683.1 MarR family transcriptional regulator [Brevibacillus agri BAB-2500]MCG5253657.1 MarR family winged helix-turn-helix transcriptional regulator [Brevibacillus agri]GED28714.1 hypothetical protein BAG01nite_48160 [Brevibacillus agri]
MTPSTITRLVDKMVQKGQLERKIEGKHVLIWQTDKGREAQADIAVAVQELHGRYSAVLG